MTPPAGHLLKALETMQIGVTITDAGGRIVWVNDADAALHGWTREELLGLPSGTYAADEGTRPLTREEARGVRRWKRERLNRRRDGSVFPARLLSDVLLDAEGNPAGIVTTCEDVTEERRNEEALRRTGVRLAAVVAAQERIARAELDPATLVRVLAERLQELCGADGGLVEVPDGNGFFARAATGSAAPMAGLWTPRGGGCAAQAVRTGGAFRCDDIETEELVDRETARRLQARSLVALPLFHGGSLVGVATVCSRRPGAFGPEAVETLLLMAGAVSSGLHHALEVEAERRLLDDRTVALAEREASYRLLFERNLAGVFRADGSGRLLDGNEAFARMLGRTRTELPGLSLADLLPPGDLAGRVLPRLAGALALSGVELRLSHCDGGTVWALGNLTWLGTGSPDGAAIEGTLLDFTDRKRMEERLLHDAFHDSLTGLANRALFLDRLAVVLRRSRRQKSPFAVLFVDLDRFKLVNDSLGHIAGDRLLAGVGQRLLSAVRPEDTVARLGGDEFAIVLHEVTDDAAPQRIAEKIIAAINEPVFVAGHNCHVGTSIGIAIAPDHAEEAAALVELADAAMYAAKKRGRNCYCVHEVGSHSP